MKKYNKAILKFFDRFLKKIKKQHMRDLTFFPEFRVNKYELCFNGKCKALGDDWSDNEKIEYITFLFFNEDNDIVPALDIGSTEWKCDHEFEYAIKISGTPDDYFITLKITNLLYCFIQDYTPQLTQKSA